jgi:hypothetical protein
MDFEKRLAISDRLTKRVRMARAEYDAAKAHFTAVVADVRSGLPAPDGAFRVQRAGEESRRSQRKYMDALRQLSDFTLRGIVPKEDQEPN